MRRALLLATLTLLASCESEPAPTVEECTSSLECVTSAICQSGICVRAEAPVILEETLPDAHLGEQYSATLTVHGGTEPFLLSMVAGSGLPEGLHLSVEGLLSGTPTVAGSATFTVSVADSAGKTSLRTLTVRVLPASGDALQITAATLPDATLGAAYSAALTAQGGTTPLAWSLASGSLPPGLTLASDGTLSGAPAVAGSTTFTVQVRDASSPAQSATATLTLTVLPASGQALAITSPSLPAGTVGAQYGAQLEATGGQSPYRWSLAAGTTLPAGLSLSTTGAIAGTPEQSGTVTFAVQVGDSGDPAQAATAQFVLAVSAGGGQQPLAITTASLPGGTARQAYSAQITASGGQAPYSFTLATGILPPGLQLSAEGTISGTPLFAGSSTFTVEVADSATPKGVATRSFSVAISGDGGQVPVALTTTSVPDGTVGTAYAQTLSASGGTSPYAWVILPGSSLPPGLDLSTAGELTGTPTMAGRYSFTVTVLDSSDPRQAATGTLTLTITSATSDLAITSANLANATADVAYSQKLAATGGTPPYAWSVAGGLVPPGLTVAADGTVAGTPLVAGTFTFTVQAADAAATPAQAQALVTLTVAPAPQPLRITTGALMPATVGAAYSEQLQASGGTQPYSWTVVAGALPEGLTLSSAGVLSGAPTAAGSFDVTVELSDSATPAATVTQQYRLVVFSQSGQMLLVSTLSLANGTQGQAYSATINALGGTRPYSFSATGNVPPGLTLSTAGVLSGTPTAAGSYDFTVRVEDSSATPLTASRSFTVTIAPATGTLAITTNGLPGPRVGKAYAQQLQATNGTTPYSWAVAAGSLPPGLTLSAAGALSGTATTAGQYTFTVEVADSSTPTPQTARREYTLNVR